MWPHALHQVSHPVTYHRNVYRFQTEDRVQCLESQRVSYKRAVTNVLPLDIPLEAATNRAELADYQVGPSEVQSEGSHACSRAQVPTAQI